MTILLPALPVLFALFWALHAGMLLRRERKRSARLALELADKLTLARQAAAAEERQRLLADLHDDIGAKLTALGHALQRAEERRAGNECLRTGRSRCPEVHEKKKK